MVTQTNKKKGDKESKETAKTKAVAKSGSKTKAAVQKETSPAKPKSTKSVKTSAAPQDMPNDTLTSKRVPAFNESMMPYKCVPYEPKTNEAYMSEGQLKHFRVILETWKRELMKEVDNTITEMKGASVLADPNDRATQEEAFSLELRTRDRERKLIRKIEEALQQIDDKEYGYCESCGIEIGIRRLEARPTAGLCIDCKTLDEIRERTAS